MIFATDSVLNNTPKTRVYVDYIPLVFENNETYEADSVVYVFSVRNTKTEQRFLK